MKVAVECAAANAGGFCSLCGVSIAIVPCRFTENGVSVSHETWNLLHYFDKKCEL